jgi:hypothetical protein
MLFIIFIKINLGDVYIMIKLINEDSYLDNPYYDRWKTTEPDSYREYDKDIEGATVYADVEYDFNYPGELEVGEVDFFIDKSKMPSNYYDDEFVDYIKEHAYEIVSKMCDEEGMNLLNLNYFTVDYYNEDSEEFDFD